MVKFVKVVGGDERQHNVPSLESAFPDRGTKLLVKQLDTEFLKLFSRNDQQSLASSSSPWRATEDYK